MNTTATRTILVVENDRLTLEFLHDMLELWGYQPHAFAAPAEALEKVRSGTIRPDLLVVDLHLDEHGTGDEVIRQIRQLPGFADIPAFVATGDLGFQATGLPKVQVLNKPIRPDRFKAALQAMFAAS